MNVKGKNIALETTRLKEKLEDLKSTDYIK